MLMKIWRLSPAQIDAYTTGADLGEPHEIVDVPVVVWPSDTDMATHRERAMRAHQTRKAGRSMITAELYSERRAAGYSDQEIAELYGIKLSTLRGYKARWKREAALCTTTV
jgi:DNA-binding CsgD family transcriptional regulator